MGVCEGKAELPGVSANRLGVPKERAERMVGEVRGDVGLMNREGPSPVDP